MHQWIQMSADLETGIEEITQAGEVIEQAGVSASTISILLERLGELAVAAGLTLLRAVIVGVIGWYIIKLISRWVRSLLNRSSLDDGMAGFLTSVITTVLRCLLVVIIIGILGIPMSSVVALVGSAGLAIGLALQGCLTNFSGGVLILVVKPFKVGDYIIDSDGNEGTVTAIDIIYTKLLTADNRTVTIPNGTLANSTVINTTREPIRRLDFNVSISYEENIDRVKKVLLHTAQESGFVVEGQESRAFVASFDPSAVKITLRFWVQSEAYWEAKWAMQEAIKKQFDAEGISMPFDQLDVHVVNKQ